MKGMVPPDPNTNVSTTCFASVYMPKFKESRKRFPASCIETFDDKLAAVKACEDDAKRFPAVVLGPSKSSEGQYIYYLVQWL